MGGREVNDMYFTDCFVSEDRVVGEVDQAWMQLMAGLNNERLIIAAQSLGMAQRAFDDVLAYVKERRQFGQPIGSFQTIKHRLADLACELEATRELVVRRGRTPSTRTRVGCSRARPRWPSSRRPSWPSAPRSRACR